MAFLWNGMLLCLVFFLFCSVAGWLGADLPVQLSWCLLVGTGCKPLEEEDVLGETSPAPGEGESMDATSPLPPLFL